MAVVERFDVFEIRCHAHVLAITQVTDFVLNCIHLTYCSPYNKSGKSSQGKNTQGKVLGKLTTVELPASDQPNVKPRWLPTGGGLL